MKQLIEDLISALEYHVEQTRPIYSTTVALQAARDALKSLQPKRTWVGLTDDEVWEWFRDNTALTNESGKRIYKAIEAKLKEKNI